MRFFSKPEMSVLMVCTANICRSPMADGLLRTELKRCGLLSKVLVDSAGTHATRPRARVDPRAQRVCLAAGTSLARLRARQVREKDFRRFDFILAMDATNLEWLQQSCPGNALDRLSLLGAWSGTSGASYEIPDPYYGNLQGFEDTFQLIHSGTIGLVAHIQGLLAH